MRELKPCPKCQSAIVAVEWARNLCNLSDFFVQCTACKLRGASFHTRNDAVENWNTRKVATTAIDLDTLLLELLTMRKVTVEYHARQGSAESYGELGYIQALEDVATRARSMSTSPGLRALQVFAAKVIDRVGQHKVERGSNLLSLDLEDYIKELDR